MRRRGPHVPDVGLAMPRDRSGHSVHYIVERMANTRWAWFGLLAALPLSLAAQDRLRTMPGYESFQRVANARPLVRGGTLAASWVDANTIEYSQASTIASTSRPSARRKSSPSNRVPANGPDRPRPNRPIAGVNSPRRRRRTGGCWRATTIATSGWLRPTGPTNAR
jgi:hypothetical protein